jgi:hypothetical protein
MATRRRAFLAVSVVLTAIGAVVLWFAFFRHCQQPPVEQPTAPKTVAELLGGSWQEVAPGQNPDENAGVETIYHFAADGTYELRCWTIVHGTNVITGTYHLDGNALQFLTPVPPSSVFYNEILERVNTIESITEERLVIVTVTKKRWTPEFAKELADATDKPVEKLLAEVREDRSRSEYVRVKNQN